MKTFDALETSATKLMLLAKQLRVRRKPGRNKDSGNVGRGSGGGGGVDGNGSPHSDTVTEDAKSSAVVGDSGGNGEGRAGRGGGGDESSTKEPGFPGSLLRSWWNSWSPYDGAAGFALMREEMLIKSNAQQVRDGWRSIA